jgi:hypothetical protein
MITQDNGTLKHSVHNLMSTAPIQRVGSAASSILTKTLSLLLIWSGRVKYSAGEIESADPQIKERREREKEREREQNLRSFVLFAQQ